MKTDQNVKSTYEEGGGRSEGFQGDVTLEGMRGWASIWQALIRHWA